jgi:rotatin
MVLMVCNGNAAFNFGEIKAVCSLITYFTIPLTDDNTKTATDWRFPWISLADSDRHVLATTNTRLQSNNTSLSKKSCEFLNDVLFKDFPAEIFLQRPSIVRVMILTTKTCNNSNDRMA